jgi:carbonic anhydrase
VAGVDEVGSIEYGVGHLHTPVLLVLGHTSCGAVTAAVQNAKVHGSIPALLNQIKPAVAKVKRLDPEAKGDDLLNKSIKANVFLTMENILRKSEEVRELVKAGQLQVVGGIYDLHTGQVSWLGPLPNQCVLLFSEEAKPAKAHGAAEAGAPKAKRGAAEPAASDDVFQGRVRSY